jgi:hypothetical protein
MPSRTRSTVALLLAGVGLSILGTVVLDVLLTRRKAQRPESATATAEHFPETRPADTSTDGHHPDSAVAGTDGAHERR